MAEFIPSEVLSKAKDGVEGIVKLVWGKTGAMVGAINTGPKAKQGWMRMRKIRTKQSKDFRNLDITDLEKRLHRNDTVFPISRKTLGWYTPHEKFIELLR